MRNLKILAIISLIFITSCNLDYFSGNPQEEKAVGGIYVMTNNSDDNKVVGYKRNEDGSLTKIGVYSTGGNGRDVIGLGFDPLGSQDPLIVDKKRRLLFAVNAGSNSISSFKIRKDGRLILKDDMPSNGDTPVALAFNGYALYVGNREGKDGGSISGYYVTSGGKLKHIDNSTVSGRGINIGSIDFSSNGHNLIIAEKGFRLFNGLVNLVEGSNNIVSMPLDDYYRPIVKEVKIIRIPLSEALVFSGEVFGDTYILASPGAINGESQGGNLIS